MSMDLADKCYLPRIAVTSQVLTPCNLIVSGLLKPSNRSGMQNFTAGIEAAA